MYTAHRVPSPQGGRCMGPGDRLGFQLCDLVESHCPSLGSMSLWAGSLGMTGVSHGIQSLTPASQSLGRESPETPGDFGKTPTLKGKTTRDMTLSLSPVPPTHLCPSGLEDHPPYQSPPHSKPGFPSV